MSWSRYYQGSKAEVVEAAKADAAAIAETLPAFEQWQPTAAAQAVERLAAEVPEGAHVTASMAGHGWQSMSSTEDLQTTAEGGNLSASVDYTVAHPAVPASSS